MANLIEVVNDITGETQHLDPEKNFFDHELYGKHVSLSETQTNALRRETKWLLHQYGYNTEKIDAVLDEWIKNKGWIINLMSRHPQYDADKFMIKFETEVERHISKSGIRKFADWACNNILNIDYWEQFIAEDMTTDEYNELYTKKSHLRKIANRMASTEDDLWEYRRCMPQTDEEAKVELLVNGKNRLWYKDEQNRIEEKLEQYWLSNSKVYKREAQTKYGAALDVFNVLKCVDKQFFDEELAERFNRYLKDGGFETEAKKGQKVSKLISKFCIEIGMDKLKDEQNVAFTDQSGQTHSKTKDMGFNYYFYSVFADAINPTKKKMWVCFSVNPIDYLTMSFGNSWSSCHTIDVDQLRTQQGDGTHNYHGMYSSGTMSYLLDESSIVMYYVNPEGKDELKNGIVNPELKDKFKRCMFYIGENKIIQSRVYPDGRNSQEGTDEDGIAAQLAFDMRAQFEEMISRCMNVPNNWVYKGGTSTCGDMTISFGTHYRDYTNYSDCGTAFLKIGPRLVKNTNLIKIGHDPICPCCGNTHKHQENIMDCDCITRDVEGRLITKIGAFKYGPSLFRSYEERKRYIENNYPSNSWDKIWDACTESDAKRLKAITEDAYPTSPFEETVTETETESANAESESSSVA